MRPNVKHFESFEWAALAADFVQSSISANLGSQRECTVMLTGGKSAQRVYREWAIISAFRQMTGVRFYFGDERCVSPSDPDSNFGMARQTLFSKGVPVGCSVFRMEAEDPDCWAAARRYSDALPDRVDVLLLGVGEDGHIASLFPHSDAFGEASQRVVPVSSPLQPCKRLTVVPQVISLAKSIIVLASGAAKAAVLSEALRDPSDFKELPARMALSGTWLLDTD